MKLYCASCNRLVADITGQIRREAVMVCRECLERYRLADGICQQAREQAARDMPDFLRNVFK